MNRYIFSSDNYALAHVIFCKECDRAGCSPTLHLLKKLMYEDTLKIWQAAYNNALNV